MSLSKVIVASAVYVPAGRWLDGADVSAPTWAMPGEHEIETELALEQESLGMLEIISTDGAAVYWAACCGGNHDH